jgi:hypothetical protein
LRAQRSRGDEAQPSQLPRTGRQKPIPRA